MQKINNNIEDLYNTLHPTSVENTLFSGTHGTVCRTGHILGHKTSLNKFKWTEIIQSMFFDYNRIK